MGQVISLVHDVGHGAHDGERHVACTDERLLERGVLGSLLLGRRLGQAVRGGKGLEGARVLVHERDEAGAQRVEPLERGAHLVLHVGVGPLSHREVAHHGSERRRERARVSRGPAAARRRRRAGQLVDEGGVVHGASLCASVKFDWDGRPYADAPRMPAPRMIRHRPCLPPARLETCTNPRRAARRHPAQSSLQKHGSCAEVCFWSEERRGEEALPHRIPCSKMNDCTVRRFGH